jgi:hypothetical protein
MVWSPIDPVTDIKEFDDLLQENKMLPDFYVVGASVDTILEGLRTLSLAHLGWQHNEEHDSHIVRIEPTSEPLLGEVRLIAFWKIKAGLTTKMYWNQPRFLAEPPPTPRFDAFVKLHEPLRLILRHFNSVHGTRLSLHNQSRRDLIPHISPTAHKILLHLAEMKIVGWIDDDEWARFLHLVDFMKYMKAFPSQDSLDFLLRLYRIDDEVASQFINAYPHLVRFLKFQLNR